MHRRLLSAAATGALLLGLAACADPNEGPVTTPPPDLGIDAPSDGGGGAEPSDGGDGDDTEAPTAAAPDIPPPDPAEFAGMDEHTAEGAEQAFRYYIAVLTWSRQTGDTGPLNALFSDNCVSCGELSSAVTTDAERGEYWKDVEITDTGTDHFESTNYEVEVGYVFIISQHSEDGSSEQVPAQEWTGVAGMTWASGSWVIDELALEATDDEA